MSELTTYTIKIISKQYDGEVVGPDIMQPFHAVSI